MDPRIHWQDILMRVELPNRTAESDRKLQNSTNNLINRHEHKNFFQLSWHTTGANRTRRNDIRNMVLRSVNEAHPPLPPNSTRGLTPGLIDPRLGNIPGNSIAFPPGPGRIRVQGRQQRATRAAAAAAPGQAQGSQAIGKRHRSSSGHQGRKPKRQARDFQDETSEDDTENTYDGTKSSEVSMGTPDLLWILLISLRVHRYRTPAPDLKQHRPKQPKHAANGMDLLRRPRNVFPSEQRVKLREQRGLKLAAPRRARLSARLSLSSKRTKASRPILQSIHFLRKEIPALRLRSKQAIVNVVNVKSLGNVV